jgi:hypothetical protein
MEVKMAGQHSPEEKNLLKLIESVPFEEEDKSGWTRQIHEAGMTIELLNEIHAKLQEIPVEKFAGDWQHAKFNMDFAGILKRWQLGEASRHFKHNR